MKESGIIGRDVVISGRVDANGECIRVAEEMWRVGDKRLRDQTLLGPIYRVVTW